MRWFLRAANLICCRLRSELGYPVPQQPISTRHSTCLSLQRLSQTRTRTRVPRHHRSRRGTRAGHAGPPVEKAHSSGPIVQEPPWGRARPMGIPGALMGVGPQLCGLPRIPLPRIPVHKPRRCFAVIAGSSCFATLPSHAASGRRAEMLYKVAFEGANLTKMSLVMATVGWPTICCSRCCGSTTRIVRVTVVAAAGFG